ncbi:MAG: TRAP transporter large permease subunit [Hoeflea sp.]|uniref:TRAP transporter large permease n=1 Tax=Hoeflea sp. TaxID=1940281 RepID=UPI0032ED9DF2
MAAIVFLGSLFGSIAIGMPIAFALLTCALVLMAMEFGVSAQILAQKLIDGADSYPLMAIPFFLLAGEFMNAGGLSRRIVAMAMSLVGHYRGGLGYVVIGTGLLFASLSGSAIADTATLAVMLLPMMRQAGYDLNRSAGLMAATGIIAPIIPPSIGFILLGVTANLSITRLFMAGIVPGLLMALSLVIVWWMVSRDARYEPMERKSWGEVWKTVKAGSFALVMPVIIVGGLKFGIFTPTEAGIIAAAYALVISVAVYREMTIKALYEATLSAAKMTAVIMLLVAASMVSAYLITIANIPAQVVSLFEPLLDSPRLLLLAIALAVLLIGMVLDFTPAILIMVPVLMPVVKQAGIDPVYFGVLFVMTAAIGMITPPVGAVLNAVCGVGRIPIEGAVKGVLPFVFAEIAVVILLILWPELVTVPAQWLYR